MMQRVGLSGALVLWASTGCASFDAPTLCTGQMRFYNEDQSFETYALRITLDAAGYDIQATNLRTDNATQDSGTCTDYLGAGCRHDLEQADAEQAEYYVFTLEPRDDGRYLYSETWWDGFSGETPVDCRPVPRS